MNSMDADLLIYTINNKGMTCIAHYSILIGISMVTTEFEMVNQLD